MKRRMVLGVLACMALIGCQKGEAPASNLFGSSARGRYLGVAVYAPGRMWEQVVRAGAPTDSAAATLKDDEQVIVVVDSATGELRQCGNLSGLCIAMSPWSKPAASVSTALLKHAQQLDDEAAVQAREASSPARRTE